MVSGLLSIVTVSAFLVQVEHELLLSLLKSLDSIYFLQATVPLAALLLGATLLKVTQIEGA